jgi:hypothetical protein
MRQFPLKARFGLSYIKHTAKPAESQG